MAGQDLEARCLLPVLCAVPFPPACFSVYGRESSFHGPLDPGKAIEGIEHGERCWNKPVLTFPRTQYETYIIPIHPSSVEGARKGGSRIGGVGALAMMYPPLDYLPAGFWDVP